MHTVIYFRFYKMERQRNRGQNTKINEAKKSTPDAKLVNEAEKCRLKLKLTLEKLRTEINYLQNDADILGEGVSDF